MADIASLVIELRTDPKGVGYVVVKGKHSAAHKLYMDPSKRTQRGFVRPEVALMYLANEGLLNVLAIGSGSTEAVKSAARFFHIAVSRETIGLDMDDSEVIAMGAAMVSDALWTQGQLDGLDSLSAASVSRGQELNNPATVKDVRKAFEIIGV